MTPPPNRFWAASVPLKDAAPEQSEIVIAGFRQTTRLNVGPRADLRLDLIDRFGRPTYVVITLRVTGFDSAQPD